MSAGLQIPVYGGGYLSAQTQTAGTPIIALVPPFLRGVTRITTLVYTPSTTEHDLYVMQELGRTTVASPAATGQAVINLLAQPNGADTVAANDYLCWDNGDGTYSFDKVASVSSLAITMTSNVPKALIAGRQVWMFGQITDTVPGTGLGQPKFITAISSVNTYTDNVIGVAGPPPSSGATPTNAQLVLPYSPLLIYSANGTAAGTLNQVSYVYTDR